ncbi:MAG: transaldolase [Gammaproteobacteria bacterium]
MTLPAPQAVQALGQSLWYDHIERKLLDSGALARLIAEQGVTGLTSNPSLFEKAITGSHDYDTALAEADRRLPQADAQALFYELAIEDLRAAADLFAAVHTASDGREGWVSLEISPELANDTVATIDAAEALFHHVDRPNLLIKVPGTSAALRAIETLIDRGINVNITLLFAVERYQAVADAYLLGLEARLRRGRPLDTVHSVASFFVSRVDTLIDTLLQALIAQADPEQGRRAQALLGRTAIANAKLAYAHYQALVGSPRFQALAEAGARPQRLLWASTGTKNPAYSDLLYVEPLIGRDTINTLPPATLSAFNDHGRVAPTLESGLDAARQQLAELGELGIDLDAATRQLEADGIQAFADAYHRLLRAIEAKRRGQ